MVQIGTSTVQPERWTPLRRGLSQSVPYPRRQPAILMIADDDAICRLIASRLAPEGYKVESAASAVRDELGWVL
jgi:hypothetical protein